MNKITSITMRMLLSYCFLVLACSSSRTTDILDETGPALKTEKILIVYLSRTSNTKTIAEMIHQYAGGELVALELQNPYPGNYRATVEQVVRENETNFLPPLKTKIDSIEKYDVVFVGFTTWGMKLPPPVKSFLKQYDLRGKTIIPFNTNDGYGIGSSFDTVKDLCPNSIIVEGFSIQGGVENGQARLGKDENRNEAETKLKQWLKKINLIKQVS